LWILIGFVSLAVLVFLVLCIPLDFVIEYNTDASPRFRKRFVWLFGLVRMDPGSIKTKRKKGKKEEEAEKKPEGKKDFRFVLRILKIEGLFKKLTDFIKEVFSLFKIEHLRADITLGFESPADTGMLFAWLYPVNYMLRNLKFYDVNLQPSFAGELVFEGSIYSSARVWPVHFTTPLIKLIFSATTIRVIGEFIKGKWKRS
jgi:hypothetical protein